MNSLCAAHAQNANVSGFNETAIDDVCESKAALDELLPLISPSWAFPSTVTQRRVRSRPWIDRIVVAGKTFTYGGGNGPVGLAGGNRMIVLLVRSGIWWAAFLGKIGRAIRSFVSI